MFSANLFARQAGQVVDNSVDRGTGAAIGDGSGQRSESTLINFFLDSEL
jgi:hypothetical protein